MNLLHIRHFVFCLMFTLFLVSSNASQAQTGVEPSSGEDVAIAFFKTAGTNPDFDKWAKGGQAFKKIAPARASDFLFDEKQRLMRLWQKYDSVDPIIDVTSNVLIELKTTADEEGNQFYWMYLSFGNDDVVYFPYEYQEYKIAVIPQMIETLMIQQIQKEQYDLMLAEFQNKTSGEAKLSLQLKPVKAYIHQPYKIDGQEQWALLTDIATMSIKSHQSLTPFWNYGADWYMSPVTEELRDLYQASGTNGADVP